MIVVIKMLLMILVAILDGTIMKRNAGFFKMSDSSCNKKMEMNLYCDLYVRWFIRRYEEKNRLGNSI